MYFPLGGNRKGEWITYRNLIITFVVSGIWHGANWTFVVWGALHAGAVLHTRARTGRLVQAESSRGCSSRPGSSSSSASHGSSSSAELAGCLADHSPDRRRWLGRSGLPGLLLLLVLAVWIYQLLFTSGPRACFCCLAAGAARARARDDRVPLDRRPAGLAAVHLLPVLKRQCECGSRVMPSPVNGRLKDVRAGFLELVRLSLASGPRSVLCAVVFVVGAPILWERYEPLQPGPDYRMPYDLSNDYWLYDRYASGGTDA